MDADGQFGVLTLLIAGSVITAVACVLLMAAVREVRDAGAISWWVTALLTRSILGLFLAAGFGWSIPWLTIAGAALIPLGATAMLSGVRVFHGRSAPPWMFVFAAAAWVVGVQLPFPAGEPAAAALASGMAISAILQLAACYELWRGRAEKLFARWPLIAVVAFHAAVFLGGAVDMALGNEPTNGVPPLVSWFSLTQLEFIMLLLASAVLVVMMCRERLHANQLAAASIDSVTGVSNRATFFGNATRILERAGQDGTSVSLILFDLDNFKAINDTFGHAAGDGVLRAFSDTAGKRLRPVDLIGRVGGDEFCLILSGAGLEEASIIAERIRYAFAASPLMFGGLLIPATVSAGVATNNRTAAVEALLAAADQALYRAKSGRNRVERAHDVSAPVETPDVSRAV
jgi:diguanylate cyclase (GGDEF)-like protein